MEYHILNGEGEKIALFKEVSDRDYCFDTLDEMYPDANLTIQNDV